VAADAARLDELEHRIACEGRTSLAEELQMTVAVALHVDDVITERGDIIFDRLAIVDLAIAAIEVETYQ
jgi:hypothetical protein